MNTRHRRRTQVGQMVMVAAAALAAGCGPGVEVEGLSTCLTDADVSHTRSGGIVNTIKSELDVKEALVTDAERIHVVVLDTEGQANDVRDDLQRILTRASESWIGEDGIPQTDEFVVTGNSVVYYRLSPDTPDAKAVQRCIGLSPDPGLLSEDPDVHRGEDVVAALSKAGFHIYEDNQRFSLVQEGFRQSTLERVDWYTTTVPGGGHAPGEGQMQVWVMSTPEAATQLEESQRGSDDELEIDPDAVEYLREGNVLVKYYSKAPDGTAWADRSADIETALLGLAEPEATDPPVATTEA